MTRQEFAEANAMVRTVANEKRHLFALIEEGKYELEQQTYKEKLYSYIRNYHEAKDYLDSLFED